MRRLPAIEIIVKRAEGPIGSCEGLEITLGLGSLRELQAVVAALESFVDTEHERLADDENFIKSEEAKTGAAQITPRVRLDADRATAKAAEDVLIRLGGRKRMDPQ